MEWSKFQTYNMSSDKAFETLCNQLFENWCNETYLEYINNFVVVNGSGGDGGVESYSELRDGSIIALQAKWFCQSVETSQFNQIKNSIKTAMNIRPKIFKYIVCLPRNLSSITGRNKGSNNCEQSRWSEMVESFREDYPNLEIELWDEFRIERELSKSNNSGIFKFWFINSQIDIDLIKYSFDRAKCSWLMAKYVPELNACGEIENNVLHLLGTKDAYAQLADEFNKILLLCKKVNCQYTDLISVCDDKFKAKLNFFETTNAKISEIISQTEMIIRNLQIEANSAFDFDETIYYFDFERIAELLGNTLSYNYHFHYYELKNSLLKLSKIDYYSLITEYKKIRDKRNLYIIGNPGTGKTHGISAVSERILSDKIHIPLVIQSKYITNDMNWKDILVDYLGISNMWSEDELWQGLISLSNLYKTTRANIDSSVKIIPKVIIFVDALDESLSMDKWNERIAETVVISKMYPQIKFCFTSRYKYNDAILDGDINYYKLSTLGDVAAYELYNAYLKAYNVKVLNNNWLKYSIRTPLMLKLFCENNQNKVIDDLQPIDVSMANLWRSNIEMIEKEFSNKSGMLIQNQCILKSIIVLSEEFLKSEKIQYERCIEILLPIVNGLYKLVQNLMDFLSLHGILGYTVKEGKGYEPSKYYYQKGIQGYFDYIESQKLLQTYGHPEEIDFNELKHVHVDTLYALTLLSISEYGYLLTKNKTIKEIDNDWLIDDLQWLGLINSNHENGVKFVARSLQIMSENADGLMTIVNNVVLPLSRDVNHPLGVKMLDSFLNSFENPAQRDMTWSIPQYLNKSYNTKWYIREELKLLDNEYELTIEDQASGLPLLYAWSLSSVNNINRKEYRNRLTKWALMCPYRFFDMFQSFNDVNDPQIKSELFAILACIAYEITDDILLKSIATWIEQNILSVDKIDINRDISIRYYSIAVLHKCISRNIFTKDELAQYLPPYNVQNNDININELAFSGTRMHGYKAIDYDLSRYVLIDPICSNYKVYGQNNQLYQLITNIGNIDARCKGINEDQFILGAAYAFLLNSGWNERDFYYVDENISHKGLDLFIRDTYGYATHGSKNNVMTVCEKYIWQFRNYINGFLSDRLLYGDEKINIVDYGLIDDFLIPVQELEQLDPDNLPDDRPWYIPEKDIVEINKQVESKDDILKILKEIPEIQWEKWITVDNKERKYLINSDNLIALNMYSCFYGSSGIETCLFVNSLCIDTNDINLFLEQINNNDSLKNKLSYPTDWTGGVETSCYITPKEICWFEWKKRYDSSYLDYFENIKIENAVDECVSNFLEYGDVHYNMPSRFIRKLLGITNSNGYIFSDDGNLIKGQYSISGEKWRTAQNYLLVSKNELLDNLNKTNKSIIWLMREYRVESGLAKEKFGEFWIERSNSYIGYYEDVNFVIKKINCEIKSNLN